MSIKPTYRLVIKRRDVPGANLGDICLLRRAPHAQVEARGRLVCRSAPLKKPQSEPVEALVPVAASKDLLRHRRQAQPTIT